MKKTKIRLSVVIPVYNGAKTIGAPVSELLFQLVLFENAVLKRKPWGSSLFFVIRKRP